MTLKFLFIYICENSIYKKHFFQYERDLRPPRGGRPGAGWQLRLLDGGGAHGRISILNTNVVIAHTQQNLWAKLQGHCFYKSPEYF
jgi:hypothetical protein